MIKKNNEAGAKPAAAATAARCLAANDNKSVVRAMISAWQGASFSEMQDEYRPPNEKDPRGWQYWNPDSGWISYPRPVGVPVPREGDGPTAEWRSTATAIWAALPKKDSEVFVRKAEIDSPRHADLAERLQPLQKWARMREPREALSTNWLVADNDNPIDSGISALPERGHKAGPSPDALIRDFSAGRLRFSNGEQTERAYVRAADDKVILGEVRMPVGAMLNYPDEPGELLGPEPNPAEMARSNTYWASLFGIDPDTVVDVDAKIGRPKPRYVTAGRKRRKHMMTRAEQLETLATKPLPPVIYCPPGLPRGSARVSDSFLGCWISSTKGVRPPERWQDTADDLSRREEFDAWAAALAPWERKALKIASTAASFREIGEAFGQTGKTAERQGKALLLAANDNAAAVMAA